MPPAETAVEFARANYELLLGALVALTGIAVHYRKTGKFPLGRLPWKAIEQTVKFVSTEYFTRARPKHVPGVVVKTTPESLDTSLRPLHYESGDRYSYEYRREILNLRRPDGYHKSEEGDEELATEVHARGFLTDDGRLWMISHHEASRLEEWKEHILGSVLSWDLGRERLIEDLDRAGFEYEKIESENDADFTIVSP